MIVKRGWSMHNDIFSPAIIKATYEKYRRITPSFPPSPSPLEDTPIPSSKSQVPLSSTSPTPSTPPPSQLSFLTTTNSASYSPPSPNSVSTTPSTSLQIPYVIIISPSRYTSKNLEVTPLSVLPRQKRMHFPSPLLQ